MVLHRRIIVRIAGVAALATCLGVVASGAARQDATKRAPQLASATSPAGLSQRAFLDRYCVTCHNQRLKTAGLELDRLDVAAPGDRADIWEKVVRKMRGGVMPPAGQPRPDEATYQAFIGSLETALDRAAAAHPNPGRTEAFHRLNRTEYANAIRDLLAIDVDVEALLPADDSSYGFDNMAGVLKLDPSRMERYVLAAQKIGRLAVGSPPPAPTVDTFSLSHEQPQYAHVEGLPLGTRGGTLIHYNFPRDAEYEFKVTLTCPNESELRCDGAHGFPDPHQLEVLLDGTRIKLFTLEVMPQRKGYKQEWDDEYKVRLPVKAGPHDVGVTFLKTVPSIDFVGPGYRVQHDRPFRYEYGSAVQRVYMPFVDQVNISGPFEMTGVSETPSRRKIFICQPTAASGDLACAKKVLSALARRAYRRPVVSDSDVEGLLAFYKQGQAQGGFEAGIELALRALLVSPQFLMRIEKDPSPVTARPVSSGAARLNVPAGAYRISDVDLASRLSFFLWSSIPDDELLDAAGRQTLHTPTVLRQQVRRMLADPRSDALVRNMVGQWLEVRNLTDKRPSEAQFPIFDDGLREAMHHETELFFASIMREDRGILDLITANYSFLNERLAKHYGVPNVKGTRFRRVTYAADNPRRGILGQGSVLVVTSHPNRTSPVLRGKWILANVLGTPPPDPPANVPALTEPEAGAKTRVLSMRERMAAHRVNPVCSSCHAMIEPVGFSLEHFDPIGRWRDVDESSNPIDATGNLPDGTKFDGLAELQAAIVKRPERFVNVMVEKFLTYALGRGLEPYDMPAARKIRRDAANDNYRFSSIILGVVESLPFQMRSVAAPATGTAVAHR
jgi:hypothetical protein